MCLLIESPSTLTVLNSMPQQPNRIRRNQVYICNQNSIFQSCSPSKYSSSNTIENAILFQIFENFSTHNSNENHSSTWWNTHSKHVGEADGLCWLGLRLTLEAPNTVSFTKMLFATKTLAQGQDWNPHLSFRQDAASLPPALRCFDYAQHLRYPSLDSHTAAI